MLINNVVWWYSCKICIADQLVTLEQRDSQKYETTQHPQSIDNIPEKNMNTSNIFITHRDSLLLASNGEGVWELARGSNGTRSQTRPQTRPQASW